jgi:hypothetical protein
MNLLGQVGSVAWTLFAVFFVISVFAAPAVVVVQRCRARGKRLFRDEPTARLQGLHADTRMDHRWDA